MLIAALLGFAFGFIGSVPVAGPISALVLHRGLTGRHHAGAWIGLGAAVAEACYAFLAFWGFSTFLARHPIVEPISRLAASLLLIGLGITFARSKGPPKVEEKKRKAPGSALANAGLGFTITALNPTLIATWTAVATMVNGWHVVPLEPSSAPLFALGTLVGIAGWFLTLTGLLRRYRGRFRQATLDRVVRRIGWLVAGLGVYFGVRFVMYVVAA